MNEYMNLSTFFGQGRKKQVSISFRCDHAGASQRSRCWRGFFFEDFLFIGKGVLELCVNDSDPLELLSLGVSAGQTSRCWRGLFF